MRTLSLFDGMSCGQIALRELGITPRYYASEIDRHAILQTQFNFHNTTQLGDVTKWREWDIDWKFDLLLAGSPCQGFSFAGKQLAFDDPRSVLFFVFVDILNHIRTVNPNVQFLLENVRMKAEHEAVITQYVGVNPLYINSALVSAQNRERLYWTNIGMVQRGLFSEWYPGIPQPEDRGILLRDILESEVDEKYYLSEKMYSWLNKHAEKMGSKVKELTEDNKAGCLTPTAQTKGNLSTDYIRSGGNHSDMDLLVVAQRGRGDDNTQQLEPNLSGKTNCLTSVQKDNLVAMLKANTLTPDAYLARGTRNRDENGKAVLTSMCDRRIRRLTPLECSRLQTIPSWYKWNCSDTQIYRMLGNGWTVEVIKHILSYR